VKGCIYEAFHRGRRGREPRTTRLLRRRRQRAPPRCERGGLHRAGELQLWPREPQGVMAQVESSTPVLNMPDVSA